MSENVSVSVKIIDEPFVSVLIEEPTVISTVLHTGPQGPPGIQGEEGEQGIRGSWWWTDTGEPDVAIPALPHDIFLDTDTGDVWILIPESAPAYGFGDGPYGFGPYGG
jgi:hypothetical protein